MIGRKQEGLNLYVKIIRRSSTTEGAATYNKSTKEGANNIGKGESGIWESIAFYLHYYIVFLHLKLITSLGDLHRHHRQVGSTT